MSVLIKVREHYTLQVGRDPANWIRGPKKVKIRDKRVIAGQMQKIEILQDDGTPDPVIVRGKTPTGNESEGDSSGAAAGFGIKGSVEELTKEPESTEVTRENERVRREITAKQIMENSNTSAQERARLRIIEAAKLQRESTAKHSHAGIVQEVSDDYVLSEEENPAQVTVEDITTRARPITNRVEDSIMEVSDEELASAPVIGENAEERIRKAEQEAKPQEEGILVKGVDPEKLKRALALVGAGTSVDEAIKLYDAVKNQLLIVMKPPEFRAQLEKYAAEKSGELVGASETLIQRNTELEARVEELHNSTEALELRTKLQEVDDELLGIAKENAQLRASLTKSEERYQKLVDAAKKKTTKAKKAKKKPAPKKREENAVQEAEKNRMLQGANKTRDQKDVPKETTTPPAPSPEPAEAPKE